jgi:hypothetical protein
VRRTNSFTLEIDADKTLDVTVYEVRPMDLLELHNNIQQNKLPLGEYERLLPFCTNLKLEQLTSLYPSEMKKIIDAFREVNSDFFAPWPTIKKLAEKVGLVELITDLLNQSGFLPAMKTAISRDWQSLFASFVNEVIQPQKGTDGGTSSSASDSGKEPSKPNSKRPPQVQLQ